MSLNVNDDVFFKDGNDWKGRAFYISKIDGERVVLFNGNIEKDENGVPYKYQSFIITDASRIKRVL